MAKAEIKMPEDFLLKLSRLGDQTDTIIPKVLEAGGKVVLDKVKAIFPPWLAAERRKKAAPLVSWNAPSVFPLQSRTGTATGM